MSKEEFYSQDKLLFNERSLSVLSIKDLRDIGRKFGISSPTTMKKKELVDKILKIVYGEIAVPIRNTSGRPSVREFDINKYIERIKSKSSYGDELKDIKFGSEFGAYMVSSPTEKYHSDDNILIRTFYADGEKLFLREKEFISSPDDIEISKSTAEKFGLENFDVVEIIKNENLFKIISINGEKVANKFDGLQVDGEAIQKGKYKDFYLRTKEEIDDSILSLIKNATASNVDVVTFSTKNYAEFGAESVVYAENEDEKSIYKKLIYLTNLCEKRLYESLDIIVIIDDMFFIEDFIQDLEEDVRERLKKYIISAKDKLLELENAICAFKIIDEVTY